MVGCFVVSGLVEEAGRPMTTHPSGVLAAN